MDGIESNVSKKSTQCDQRNKGHVYFANRQESLGVALCSRDGSQNMNWMHSALGIIVPVFLPRGA